MFSYPSV